MRDFAGCECGWPIYIYSIAFKWQDIYFPNITIQFTIKDLTNKKNTQSDKNRLRTHVFYALVASCLKDWCCYIYW